MNFSFENINLFIVFAIVFQALIFAVLFFRSSQNHPEKMLGIYELLYFLNYSFIFLYLLQEYDLFIQTYFLVIPFYALFPVLFYLFLTSLVYREFKRRIYFHLIFPASLFILNSYFLLFLSPEEELSVIVKNSVSNTEDPLQNTFLVFHSIIYPLLIKIQVFIYIFLSALEIKELHRKIKEEYSNINRINLSWAIKFLVLFTFLFIISLFVFNEIYYFSFILFVNLFIGIEAIQYRSVHEEIRSNIEFDTERRNTKEFVSRSAGLPEQEKEILFTRLKEYMLDNKKYLNPDLRLSSITKDLKTNRQYLSQVINHKTGENFYHFVNKYRIDEFISRIQSEEYRNMSIEGMANNVGFRSKSAFYGAFKKEKGCTPKSFMKNTG